jgi:arginine-tRNA-protein transferase
MSDSSAAAAAAAVASSSIADFQNVVRPFGYSSMECGYCKGARASVVKTSPASASRTSQDCSKSFGMLTESMTPQVYEAFLYRGWRRSGIHLYKPANFESCCPTLTIRLKVDQFEPTKSQSKIQRKLRQLLNPTSTTSTSTSSNKSTAKANKSNPVVLRFESFLRLKTTTTSSSTSLLQTLETATRHALIESTSKLLPDPSLLQNLLPPPPTNQNNQNRLFKIRPPSKAQESERQIVLSSSICAQLAGRAKLSSSQRETFLQTVVAHLQQQKLQQRTMGSNTFLSIHSIQAHSKSGQILWTLQLSPLAWEQAMMMTAPSSMSINDNDDDEPPFTDTDKLARWYQTTTGTTLRPDQRQLRMETLPAHQSALDSRVHQLYAHYQHVVHQDPDPLQPQVASAETNETTMTTTNNDATNKDVNMENTPDTTANEDDEKQNDSSSDVVDFNEEQEDDDEDDVDPISSIPDLDWGPHQPRYFKDEVTSMLQNYLKPHSKSVQRALLNNFVSFYQFLVETPFDSPDSQKKKKRIHNSNDDNTKDSTMACGTYHQQYWIGDLLIAVGVVDVLPKGLSSVYLYYHPDMAHSLVALGKLAILKEIEYSRDVLHRPFYYLGYYIESCPKMRYKADYHPSQLLCPVSYEWVNCPKAIPKLQQTPQHVCALVDEEEKKDKSSSGDDTNHKRTFSDAFLSEIPMDIGAGMAVTLDMLQENGKQVVRPILQELSYEAGAELSRQCLVKLT